MNQSKIYLFKDREDYIKKITDDDIYNITGEKGVTMEYALGGLSNNIFASSYTYYIPDKEQLISEVEKVLERDE